MNKFPCYLEYAPQNHHGVFALICEKSVNVVWIHGGTAVRQYNTVTITNLLGCTQKLIKCTGKGLYEDAVHGGMYRCYAVSPTDQKAVSILHKYQQWIQREEECLERHFRDENGVWTHLPRFQPNYSTHIDELRNHLESQINQSCM